MYHQKYFRNFKVPNDVSAIILTSLVKVKCALLSIQFSVFLFFFFFLSLNQTYLGNAALKSDRSFVSNSVIELNCLSVISQSVSGGDGMGLL